MLEDDGAPRTDCLSCSILDLSSLIVVVGWLIELIWCCT